MEEKEDRKYNIIAIAAALLLHGVVCLLMLLSYINYTAPEEQPPLQPKTDITFGGEYVMLGDMPLPNLDNGEAASSTADESSLQAEDETNSGEQGEGTSLVSTNESSEMSSENFVLLFLTVVGSASFKCHPLRSNRSAMLYQL